MLTTSSRNRDIERNMGLGAVAYNEKTFDPDDLNEIVGMLRGYAMGKRTLSKQPYWRDGSIE